MRPQTGVGVMGILHSLAQKNDSAHASALVLERHLPRRGFVVGLNRATNLVAKHLELEPETSISSSVHLADRWPIKRMEDYIREGVGIGDLSPKDADRAVATLHALDQNGKYLLKKPDVATNEFHQTVFIWMPGDNLAELRVTPEEFQAMYDNGRTGGDTQSESMDQVINWLIEQARFIRN